MKCHPCQRRKKIKESAGPLGPLEPHSSRDFQASNSWTPQNLRFLLVCACVWSKAKKRTFCRERHPSLSVAPKYILKTASIFKRPVMKGVEDLTWKISITKIFQIYFPDSKNSIWLNFPMDLTWKISLWRDLLIHQDLPPRSGHHRLLGTSSTGDRSWRGRTSRSRQTMVKFGGMIGYYLEKQQRGETPMFFFEATGFAGF